MKLLSRFLPPIPGWTAAAALLLCVGLSGNATEVKVGDFSYDVDETARTAKVINSDDYAQLKEVVIPSTIQYLGLDYTVTSVGYRAFYNASGMTSITIPATVTEIYPQQRFNNNSFPGLKSITFEESEQPLTLQRQYIPREGNVAESWDNIIFYNTHPETLYLGRNLTMSHNGAEYSSLCDLTQVTGVTVSSKCTAIPDGMFAENGNLTVVRLPNVKTIGRNAFLNCKKLATLSLGNSLETVEDNAFYGCSSITQLIFPKTIKTIGTAAFYGCSAVTQLTFPATSPLTSIGARAFYNLKAFTAVRLPNSVESIGQAAFYGCTKLTMATVGTSITSVADSTFMDCPALAEMELPEGVTNIRYRAFMNCTGMAVYSLPQSLKSIGGEVFRNNSGLPQITIPGNVMSMGDNSFKDCTRLAYLTFSDGEGVLDVKNSSNYFGDSPLRTVYIGRDITFESSGLICDITSIARATIGPKVTFLHNKLFKGCSGLTDITLPEGLLYIRESVFANCTGLSKLYFPGTLLELGNYSVDECTSLIDVRFNDGKETATIGTAAKPDERGRSKRPLFVDAPLQKLYVGRNLTYSSEDLDAYKSNYIFGGPFAGQKYLTDITFSQSGTVTFIHDRLLLNCSVCQEMLLPESLQSIGVSAFEGMSALKSTAIPDAVTALGSSAYKNCAGLATAKLSANLPVINYSTFSGCSSLEGTTIPDKVAEIDDYAFCNCASLGYVNMGKGLKKINDDVFNGCSALPSLVIPVNVTNIGNRVFDNCTSLADVTLADGNPDDYLTLGNANYQYREQSWSPLRTMYKGLFRDCPVERLHLGRWLIYDTDDPAESPFSYITTLKDLEIGETCGMIGKYAFTGCSSLNPLFVPENVESIGEWAFKECTSLNSVTLSEGLISLGEQAFYGCTSLPEITIPESLPALSDETFRGCTALATANLGSSLETIGPRVFMDCSALTDAAIPESVYALGVESFANCTSLPAIVIPDGMLRNVGSKSFNGCSAAGYVSLGKRVTSIGDDAFGGCGNIGYIRSYNTVPPEGVTGFSEEIEKTATLYVPEVSIDMYKYSFTWENFFNIKPLSNDILVESITVTPSEASLHLNEQLQLTATVSNDDATDKTVAWSSADETIATVDESGIVTAIGVGSVTITAEAVDGSHIKGSCEVTVLPTLVESITIEEQNIRLKVDKKIQLTAVVGPDDASDKTLVWTTSNSKIADVDANGLVTAGRYYSGDVTITATAADGSGISASCLITVYDRTQGDANDDDKVNVTDAMTIYNYINNLPTNGLDIVALDVNNDCAAIGNADLYDVIPLILAVPYSAPENNGMEAAGEAGNRLVAANISISGGGTNTLDISIENSTEFAAMQFDAVIPEGISVNEVTGSLGYYAQKVNWKQIEDNVIRIIICPQSGGAELEELVNRSLVTLSLTADQAFKKGDLALHNIVAVDPECHEYTLASTGGHIEDTSGIGDVTSGETAVKAVADGVEIYAPCASTVSIYRADGIMVDTFVMDSGKAFKPLCAGVYIVTVNNTVHKLYIR